MIATLTPLWARALLAIAIVMAICGAGIKIGHTIARNAAAGKVASAQHQRDAATQALATYQMQVREAAASQAINAATTTLQQTRTTMESAHAHVTHRTRLLRRMDTVGLRYPVHASAGLCRCTALADPAARTADRPAQPLPAQRQRDPEEPPDRLANPLPPAELIANAALDAQQLADLIDTACKLGLCAPTPASP